MKFIDKDSIEYLRFAIAKKSFIELYEDTYGFIKDFPKSNCMLMIEHSSRKEEIISLFVSPTIKVSGNVRIYCEPARYSRVKSGGYEKYRLVDDFMPNFRTQYESILLDSEAFYSKLSEGHHSLFTDIVWGKDDIDKYEDVVQYKYHKKETIEERKYNVVDGQIAFCAPVTFNDPFDTDDRIIGEKTRNNLRTFCVAEQYDNILMWSYYASEHKGYCIEYKKKEILRAICESSIKGICFIGGVDYKTKYHVMGDRKFSHKKIIDLIEAAFTKDEVWEHEGEFRYVIYSEQAYVVDGKPEPFKLRVPIEKVYTGVENCTEKESLHTIFDGNIPLVRLRKHSKQCLVQIEGE